MPFRESLVVARRTRTIVYEQNALKELVREKALQFGDFTLVSGKKAKYYLDGKQVTLDAAGARLVGEGMLELLADSLPDAVGGEDAIQPKGP